MAGFLVRVLSSPHKGMDISLFWWMGCADESLGEWKMGVEVKMLKSLVRNIVDPARDLGHVDRALKQSAAGRDPSGSKKEEEQGQERQPTCEDCR